MLEIAPLIMAETLFRGLGWGQPDLQTIRSRVQRRLSSICTGRGSDPLRDRDATFDVLSPRIVSGSKTTRGIPDLLSGRLDGPGEAVLDRDLVYHLA